VSFARLSKQSKDTLLISGYRGYSPTPTSDSFNLDPMRFVFPPDFSPLVLAIRSGTAIAMSDGSHMPHRYPGMAAAAWLFSDSFAQKTLLFYGVTPVSGSSSQINAYRAELYGMYSLLVALEYLCSVHHIIDGGVLIGCDNKSVIFQAQAFYEYVPCHTLHADLIRAITSLRLRSTLKLRFIYVPGHQDALVRFEDLPPHQRLNVWADSLAKCIDLLLCCICLRFLPFYMERNGQPIFINRRLLRILVFLYWTIWELPRPRNIGYIRDNYLCTLSLWFNGIL